MLLWVKAFHIIFMVTWFAGLFYLPRLFVYHALTDDTLSHDRFVVMERKLFIMMTMGAILTAIFGVWLIVIRYPVITEWPIWFILKLSLLTLLVGYHLYCLKILRIFRNNENLKSHVFYRWFNEAPVLILVAIVCLVVVKPFVGTG